MSFLNRIETNSDNADVPFSFVVDNLFTKLDSVHAATLGRFSTVTAFKVHIIREFVARFRTLYGSDIIPTSRLVLPDKAGRRYYIKNVVLAQLIIKMYNVPHNTDDYRVLKRWKLVYHLAKRFSQDTRNLRDLPLRALRIIANRRKLAPAANPGHVTVSRVNTVLDSLSDALKSRDQIAVLKPLLDECSIPQVRWILHFILNKTILSRLEHVFFEEWHPDAPRLYQVCNSLSQTFNYLKDPQMRMDPDQLNIKPMFPFKPQLSQRLTTNYNFLVQDMQVRSNQLMDKGLQEMYDSSDLNGKFYIEEKMDGDRMLLHYKKGAFKFFTRRLKDYSLLYGESYATGALTPYLRGAFPDLVDSIVLDGEMVAWDHLRQQILPFGTLKLLAIQETVRQFTTIDHYTLQHSLPFFLAFDIVHLNGKNLANHPLFFRKAILQKVIRPIAHYLEVLPYTESGSISDIQDVIRKTVVERREGVIVKHVQLTYQINHRSHQWVKIKPEYLETFGDNLDVVIMGKNPAIKNAYMCGLMDDEGKFRSFCTVANGFTDAEYDKIERHTHGKWHLFEEESPPLHLLFGTKKPKMWIEPLSLLVLEVKARLIDVSPQQTYAVGTTLHNLYCRSIRHDKTAMECATLSEYLAMKAHATATVDRPQTALVSRKPLPVTLYESRKSHTRLEQLLLLVSHSTIFTAFEIVILSDHMRPNGIRTSALALASLVKAHGGKVVLDVQKNSPNTLVISEMMVPLCGPLVKRGYTIIKPRWIFECVSRQLIVPLEPVLVLATADWGPLASGVDANGDSYIVHTNHLDGCGVKKEKTLVEVGYESVQDDGGSLVVHHEKPSRTLMKVDPDNIEDFLMDCHQHDTAVPLHYMFHGSRFYIVREGSSDMSIEILKNRLRSLGAEITSQYELSTFIIVPKLAIRDEASPAVTSILTNIANGMVNSNNGNLKPTPQVVFSTFIDTSVKRGVVVDARDHGYF